MTSLPNPVALPTSLFEKREELRRILESKHFASSPKKSRFLEFVSEQAFLGNGEKLNEYLIGVEVYDRGPDFNSQKDPIVRVQAHEIRRLLKKYYEEEGKDKSHPRRLAYGRLCSGLRQESDEGSRRRRTSDRASPSPFSIPPQRLVAFGAYLDPGRGVPSAGISFRRTCWAEWKGRAVGAGSGSLTGRPRVVLAPIPPARGTAADRNPESPVVAGSA